MTSLLSKPVVLPGIDDAVPSWGLEDLLSMARDTGLRGGQALRIVLRRQAVRIYDFAQVCDYLDGEFGCLPKNLNEEVRPSTFWRSGEVRYHYFEQKWGWRALGHEQTPTRAWNTPDRQCMLSGPYDRPVPLGVLAILQKICLDVREYKLGEMLSFVSDRIGHRDDRGGDPFLMVCMRESQDYLVIARWDEPTFGGAWSPVGDGGITQ